VPDKDYSGTPLSKKLGIKPCHHVHWAGAPKHFPSLLEPLPDDVEVKRQARGPLDVIVLFATGQRDLEKKLAKLKAALDPAGGLWVAYPKKSSAIETDITFESAQKAGLDEGLVDNKSCAIDDDWSGLRFVYRLKDRPR
jgi:hypothetical protein